MSTNITHLFLLADMVPEKTSNMNAVILCPLGDRDFAATPAFLLTSLNIPCSLLQGMFDSRELFDSYIRSLTLVRLWRTVVSMDWDGECVRYSSSTKKDRNDEKTQLARGNGYLLQSGTGPRHEVQINLGK